jgi:opacity protein-like surface antigen
MKKLLAKVPSLALVFTFSLTSAHSQSFEKGNIIGTAGVGIGIYSGSSNAPDVGGAVPVVIPIEVEYGITDRFGAALTYQYGSYLSDDSITNSARTHNIGANGYFHFAVKEKSNLYAKVGLGYSNFGYKQEDSNGITNGVKAQGIWYNFGLGWRKMFGNRVGFFLNADWTITPLWNFKGDDGNVWQTGNPPENVKITFSGLEVKAGIVVKLK